ncbi:cupin domain-containing protein [Synechococcus elongatus]|uniref:cupin domain-containing protein n=1 Tax=Synechococcus elongatus TaxID=32046 RepID=UPI0030D56A3A
MAQPQTAEEWITALDLQPHPEGGFYREIYRADLTVTVGDRQRSASTAIYYLLRAGERSRLHRLRSDELWHFYAGQPLTVHQLIPEQGYQALTIGADFSQGQQLCGGVPAGVWFGATVAAATGFSLVGCTVAPGFSFEDFEMAEAATLLRAFPEARSLIEQLT